MYFADLTPMNVFITTEILKCEIQSRTSQGENTEYKFNSYIGDTLELDIKDVFKVDEFDAIIGNPPYNSSGSTSTGNTIWQDFTHKSLDVLLNINGLLLFVHPPGWRKPNTLKGKFYRMFEKMTRNNQIVYLEIHGIKDGQKIFRYGTRYDWYLIEHVPKYKNTIVIDENNIRSDIDLSVFNWLPNSNIIEIKNMMARNNEEKCNIIYDRTAYGADKKNRVKIIQDDEYKYPLIHSTPQKGIRYMYSNVNDRGHFGIPKVIFGESGIYNPIVDFSGDYGMTHGAMAIKINTLDEGKKLSIVLQSESFKKILQSCFFSSFRIDWNLFKEFRTDFWKDFINAEPSKDTVNNIEHSIIKIEKTNYYLIDNKLYKINKNKSRGEYYSDYISDKKTIMKKTINDNIIETNINRTKPIKVIKKKVNELYETSKPKKIVKKI